MKKTILTAVLLGATLVANADGNTTVPAANPTMDGSSQPTMNNTGSADSSSGTMDKSGTMPGTTDSTATTDSKGTTMPGSTDSSNSNEMNSGENSDKSTSGANGSSGDATNNSTTKQDPEVGDTGSDS